MARQRVARILTCLVVIGILAAGPAAAQEPSPPTRGAQLTLLHINDVYETLPIDGEGGLARIATLKRRIEASGHTPLVTIGGDFLSSSVASTVFKGQQMIDGFNAMGLDIATLGNHEFDFGKDVLLQRMAESRFQYVMSNVLDEATGKPIGNAVPYSIRAVNGLKVGFFGLCLIGEEVSPERRRGLRFLPPLDAAGTAVAALRSNGVDAIVAVTHLSYDEDRQLALRYPDISVILGGHEHYPITAVVGRTLISKAGSDAKRVARIDLRKDGSGVDRHIELIPIDKSLPDDPATARVVADYETRLGTALDTVVATSVVPLEGESRQIRSSETNLGNLLADAMRAYVRADVAIINSGSIRGDRTFAAGQLSRRELLTMQPFGNKVCKLEVTGRTIVDALKSATESWPAAAGRFPQVSGVSFSLDRNRPAGDRVSDVRVGGTPIALDRRYTLATSDYQIGGGDGYTMFANQRMLVGPEAADLIVTALEQYIAAAKQVSPKVEGRIQIR
jgi:2',3'-cyclic-nucleotide 2'-phosphodiesterase (5'-nucleotidase family)